MNNQQPQAAEHNYLKKLAALFPGVGIYEIVVFHDDWCDFQNAGGVCNCDPDIELMHHAAPYSSN